MILRSLFASVALGTALLAVPAISQKAARPWTEVAAPAPAGSYVVGNPKARVKLVEYLSYTCPHCAHFAAESDATITAMVRSGSTSVEVRNQVHDGFDLVAATLARCAGPAAFPRLHHALLAKQGEWVPRAVDWQQANAARLQAQPQLAQLRALVDGSGLGAIAAANGMAKPRVDACFATDTNVKQTLTVSNNTAKVSGTPAFEINGRLVERVDWAKLRPMLVAAGAK